MTTPPVGLRALAVYYPEHVRTNDYWRERHGDLIGSLEQKLATQVWEPGAARTLFSAEMAAYAADPFRGSVERRVLPEDQLALDMEVIAARRALDAAGLGAADIGFTIVTSLFADQICEGNAVHLARALGLTSPAINTESACGSFTANLSLAHGLVASGQARHVLVVLSCTYSRNFDARNPMSWTSGDGCAAIIVGPTDAGTGILAHKGVNTQETIGSFDWVVKPHPRVKQTPTFTATRIAGALLEQTAERCVPLCTYGAAEAAGVSLRDVAYFAMPNPVAWYGEFARKKLGYAPELSIDHYRRFTNTGPVLTPSSLYFGAREGRMKKGDLVLAFCQGSVSTAGAVVMRWGDVAVADAPEV